MKLNFTFFTPSAGMDMGGIYRRWGSPPQTWGGLEHLDGRTVIPMAGRPTFSAFIDFGRPRPTPPISLDTYMKRFSKICQTLADRPRKWGRLIPLWLGLCAMSSPHVVLSVTMSYFEHDEVMHGFWSIWYFPVIRCSLNGRSTKLVELVSNKHLSSISWMECRYVGDKYMHFMTANKDPRIASMSGALHVPHWWWRRRPRYTSSPGLPTVAAPSGADQPGQNGCWAGPAGRCLGPEMANTVHVFLIFSFSLKILENSYKLLKSIETCRKVTKIRNKFS
jgi:hypothetical protein